jgi:hypothetical protein
MGLRVRSVMFSFVPAFILVLIASMGDAGMGRYESRAGQELPAWKVALICQMVQTHLGVEAHFGYALAPSHPLRCEASRAIDDLLAVRTSLPVWEAEEKLATESGRQANRFRDGPAR